MILVSRKKKRWLPVILISIAALLVISIGTLIFLAFSDINGKLRGTGEVTVVIPKGASASKISKELKKAGAIRFPDVFRYYVKNEAYDAKFNYGMFTLKRDMNYAEIISALEGVSEKKDGIKFTVTEGEEIDQIVDDLAKKGLGDKDKFNDVIKNGNFDYDYIKEIKRTDNRLEGYLFPDTYEFFKGEGEQAIINEMVENFNKRTGELRAQIRQRGLKLDDIIIMASIVEREGKKKDELPIVASVFYNRIKDKMKLESCATVQYILPERKDILSVADTKIDNPYNTYKYLGLPPGPISNPGLDAISAAVNPASTDYYFFVAKKDGSSLFAKTFAEHQKNCKIALH